MPFHLITRCAKPAPLGLSSATAHCLVDRRDELLLTAGSFLECSRHAETLENRQGSKWREDTAFRWTWLVPDSGERRIWWIIDHHTMGERVDERDGRNAENGRYESRRGGAHRKGGCRR